jgi:hypothetical protein
MNSVGRLKDRDIEADAFVNFQDEMVISVVSYFRWLLKPKERIEKPWSQPARRRRRGCV